MEDNLILYSGGLASAVCLHLSLQDYNTSCIGFNYNQSNKIEIEYAKKYTKKFKIPYTIFDIPNISKKDDVIYYGRNAVLLATAISFAESKGITNVTIGINKSDYIRFPDCRLTFLNAMNTVGSIYGVHILAPLINHTKEEIVGLAYKLNISLEETITCYTPTSKGLACGKCYSCLGRTEAEKVYYAKS